MECKGGPAVGAHARHFIVTMRGMTGGTLAAYVSYSDPNSSCSSLSSARILIRRPAQYATIAKASAGQAVATIPVAIRSPSMAV